MYRRKAHHAFKQLRKADMTLRFNGTIKHFNEDKGYGFIHQNGAQDLFFHTSALATAFVPRKGEQVSFETALGPDMRTRAVNIRLESASAAPPMD
jgi:cold shock protein